MKKACIIIPTYNESKNVSSLLDNIFLNEKKQKQYVFHVLIVDDNSPDGTSEIIKKYMKKNKKVHLLLRKNKEGLGKAYIDGMKYALKKIKPDVLFEMDADHSHNPDDIPKMLDAIEEGNDFVIGSRHVSGGGVSKGWGAHRKLTSFLARSISNIFLGLGGVKDCSGGFRAIRKRVFDKVILDDLDVRGYAFQVALLESVVHNGFKVKEVPIIFEERSSGESKMGVSDMLEGFIIIYKIRLKRLKR